MYRTVSFVDENLLMWAGSIQYADAYQTIEHLDAAAFPFLALLACQPPHIQVLDHMESAGGVEMVSHQSPGYLSISIGGLGFDNSCKLFVPSPLRPGNATIDRSHG